jgi:hypothetical protein
MGKSVQSRTGYRTAEEAVALYRRDLIAGSHPLKIDDVRPGLERQGFDLLVSKPPLVIQIHVVASHRIAHIVNSHSAL